MRKITKFNEKFKIKLNKLKEKNFSFKFFLFDISLLLIIVTLSFNIYKAYREGSENLGRLKIEEERLLKLQKENDRLSDEENYYKSIEFRKAYARDSLNLTREGETLYLVVRDEKLENPENTQTLFDSKDVNKLNQWKLLILGR